MQPLRPLPLPPSTPLEIATAISSTAPALQASSSKLLSINPSSLFAKYTSFNGGCCRRLEFHLLHPLSVQVTLMPNSRD